MPDKLNEFSSILLVGTFLAESGRSLSVSEDLSHRLIDSGWRVFITSQKTGRLARLFDMLVTTWRLRRSYAVANVDVYSGRAFLWAELVCVLLRLLRKPFILTLHGGGLPDFAKRWPNRVRKLLAKASKVTVPSPYLSKHMSPYRADLILIPNAIDLVRYSFHLRRRPHPSLVWLRAFHSLYNPTIAPKVVAQLKRDFPSVKLVMFGHDQGDGSLQETQQCAVALGVTSNMEFPGAIPKAEVPARLIQGDIFLNTTNVDNTPVSVLEAWASGLCVVSTNVGGIPYLLQNEENGLLVAPDDAAAMTQAVYRILTEPGLAERLSQNGREKAEQFDWSKVLTEWKRLIEQVQGTA
jgi:glycosyltransferase involved in cell wall biosynthesis